MLALFKPMIYFLCGIPLLNSYNSLWLMGYPRVDFSKPAKVKIMQNGELKPLKLIANNNLVQHTDFVGTPDRPTIDGGIINAADGLQINPVLPEETLAKESKEVKKAKNDFSSNFKRQQINKTQSYAKPFQDNWASSNKVKKVLEEAAKDGKLNHVLQQAQKKGLPASVATIPIIESRYQSRAISHKGAAGAWQLMPATAQGYGINLEQRYQFQPATIAAINLLSDLYKQFNNWELAFAAYNAGPKRIQQALNKNPSAQSVEELEIPRETKNYVHQLIALNQRIESLWS